MKAITGLSVAAPVLLGVLAGCSGKGELVEGGISAVRSACPTVAVPAATGDVTLFDPAGSQTSDAIDVVAEMTNLRSTCGDQGEQVQTDVTFDVLARRTNNAAARDVTIPYFIVLVRGGGAVVAKRVGRVTLHFDAGAARAQVAGSAATLVTRAAATLPDDIRKEITKKRKAGEEDAATDPLSRPDVRAAVLRTSFEALVGFQLTDAQLKYNATR